MTRLRFKNFMRERTDLTDTGDETLLSVSEYYGVKPRGDAFEGEEYVSRAESLEGYRRVKAGDLVMNYMLGWKGAYGVSDYDGIVSPAYAVFEIDRRRGDLRYIHHTLRSNPSRALFRAASKGIIDSRLRLYPDAFLALAIDLPALETQTAIADFLDRETSRIDRLIEKKRRLVTLLAEKRGVVALQCLSEGLEGFYWLSDNQSVAFRFKQATWNDMRVKNVVSFMTSGSRGWSNLLGSDGEVFIQSGNIGRQMEVDFHHSQRVQPQTGAEANRTLVREHDVLVCITGGRTGAVGYVRAIEERAYINQHVCLLRARRQTILPELLAQILWSEIGQKQIELCQYGVKQGLGFSELAQVKIPVPTSERQQKIVTEINTATRGIDAAIDVVGQSLERLVEFRAVFITAAVTGEIDVTTWHRRGETDRRVDWIEEKMRA